MLSFALKSIIFRGKIWKIQNFWPRVFIEELSDLVNDARTNKNQDAQEAPGKVRKCSQTKNRVEMSNKSPCFTIKVCKNLQYP